MIKTYSEINNSNNNGDYESLFIVRQRKYDKLDVMSESGNLSESVLVEIYGITYMIHAAYNGTVLQGKARTHSAKEITSSKATSAGVDF